ncbi:hypothetical protein [Streptomyces sp. NPDC004296]|uniref:hypothetical protein n=1 Tax=Streptomyces sp. NPDC004296 TaxID=3364697 RepID=UPI0036CDA298
MFGPTTAGETTYAPRLLPSLRTGMILLADHNFAAQRLLADIAATGAECWSGSRTAAGCRYWPAFPTAPTYRHWVTYAYV